MVQIPHRRLIDYRHVCRAAGCVAVLASGYDGLRGKAVVTVTDGQPPHANDCHVIIGDDDHDHPGEFGAIIVICLDSIRAARLDFTHGRVIF
jgi:hypothetical protein